MITDVSDRIRIFKYGWCPVVVHSIYMSFNRRINRTSSNVSLIGVSKYALKRHKSTFQKRYFFASLLYYFAFQTRYFILNHVELRFRFVLSCLR